MSYDGSRSYTCALTRQKRYRDTNNMQLRMLATLGLLTVGSAHAVSIDTFTTLQNPLEANAGMTTDSSTVLAAEAVGGERDMLVTYTGGPNPFSDVSAFVFDVISHAQDPDVFGSTLVQWDGADGSLTLDATGLGGIDMTQAGDHNAVALTIVSADLNAVLTFTVYTDGSNYSTFTEVLPSGATNQLLVLPFDAFTDTGTGADFTNVGAVEMLIDGTASSSLDVQIDVLETISTLTGSKDDVLQVDDGDGEPSPGDTIRYTIELENNGTADETNVVLTDTVDIDTSLDCGTLVIPGGAMVNSCNAGFGGDFSIDIGTITGGGSATVTFDVMVGPGVNGSDLCNQGVINSDSTTNALTFDLDNPVPGTETCWTATPVELQAFSID